MADEVDFSAGWYNFGNGVIPFTCADGTGIEKGALLQISDPMTAALAAGIAPKVVGVCYREKVASDGRTQVDVLTQGYLPMTCSGNVTIGFPLQAYLNRVENAGLTASGLSVIGIAMETGTDGEVILVKFAPGMIANGQA
ncbi:MAG: DUF2190 family protein [Candidatus Levybacteria bacterium]|nr:DUF2190 family protein [Candidatus Levybacteria bacterium]